MNKHVIFLSAAAVLLLSCSREADQVIQPGETITFTAAWAGSDETRTILQSDGTSVWWDAAEQINVFFSDKASGKFTSTNSQPQAIVDFQGSLPIVVGSVETENPAHAYWAVYPYNAANTCDGESVTLTVPSAQTAKEGSFADKMFPSIATSTNFYLAFYNVCGGVRFTVANEGITSITFKANNGESLAGKVNVGFNGTPIIKSVIEGASEVVVNAPTGGFVPGEYYFATLLPQTLTKGVSLTFKKDDGKVASTSLDNSITINRSRFGKMEEKDKGLEFKDDGSGPNPSDAIEFADDRLKAKLVSAFDTNGDEELSYAEAAAVTSIDGVLTIKTYTSFDEFQYFTGVTTIPESCFKDWTKLTKISLPQSITTIGASAFYNCTSLKSIIIPESVTFIDDRVFRGCSSLVSAILPNNVTFISFEMFYGCSSLESIIIPESVMNIGDSAFRGCSSLVFINIPNGVTDIQGTAFSGCSSLVSVSIPESVTYLANNVFSGCSSLNSIIVDPNNSVYDSRNNCNAIIITESNILICGCQYTTIPDSVTEIYTGAFMDCTSLESIIIPESVTNIGVYAFSGCSGLVSINIPQRLTSIEYGTFSRCTSLETIIIPENVKSIGGFAFSDCSGLVSVSIPESITIIEYNAFSGCSSLASINIPESVTKIGNNAFSGCSSLASINIPESVTNIGNNAFSGCSSLASISIPESVTNIGKEAFYCCTNLTSITILPTTPPTGGSRMFSDTNNAPIYVPAGSADTYKSAQYWSDYASRIQAIQD